MAKEHKTSLGLKSTRNREKDEKRKAKFAQKKAEGRAYEYKKNPFKEGTNEWLIEHNTRKEKAKSSKVDYAVTASRFAKMRNELNEKLKEQKVETDKIKKIKKKQEVLI